MTIKGPVNAIKTTHQRLDNYQDERYATSDSVKRAKILGSVGTFGRPGEAINKWRVAEPSLDSDSSPESPKLHRK